MTSVENVFLHEFLDYATGELLHFSLSFNQHLNVNEPAIAMARFQMMKKMKMIKAVLRKI
jgi:hypothetical protein